LAIGSTSSSFSRGGEYFWGALPLHLEDMIEGGSEVFGRRKIRVWEFERDRAKESGA